MSTIFAKLFDRYYLGRYEPKVLGKVWPGFLNKYDLDIYDLRYFQIFCFFKEYFHRCILYKSINTKSKAK